MPIYITQGRYTRDAIKGMIVRPEDRADALLSIIMCNQFKYFFISNF